MAKKIILLRPPDDSPHDFYNMVESLGLQYIASFLRSQGHEAEIVDSIILDWDVEETADYLVREEFDVLGIALFSVAVRKTWEILKIVKGEKPDIHVTVGGQYPTFAYTELLAHIPQIDTVTRHEGEITFTELVGRIRSRRPYNDVKGVALRDDKGEIHVTGERPRILDLDSLPWPARDTFPLINKENRGLSICTSRGCWAKCKYCTITAFYTNVSQPRWAGRSPTDVVDEIEALQKRFQCNVFPFVDAEFFGPGKRGKERVRAIAEEILRRKLDIAYSFDCRPEEVDEELFTLLKASGLTLVYLGLESGAQSQLDRWDRLCTVDKGNRAVDILRKLDIPLNAGFILYDPWTTIEEIITSLEFIKEVKCVSLGLFVRPMEIRPGMAFAPKIMAEGNGYQSAPFEYEWSFVDPKAALFKKIISTSFEPLLQFYKVFGEIRATGLIPFYLSARMEAELLSGAIDIALEAAGRVGNCDSPQHADSPSLLNACQTQADKLLGSAQGLLASYMAATEVKFRPAVYPSKKVLLPIPLSDDPG